MTISISNFKGGVGKTTSVVNIGSGLAEQGKRVLLIDMDAQHNLTQSLNAEQGHTIYEVLTTDKNPMPYVLTDKLHIIPADLNLIKAEIELSSAFHREHILEKKLKSIADNYDYILIDCPPSLGLITVNAFVASDLIFVPVEAEYLSLKGYSILSEAVQNIGLEIDRAFVTKYDSRKILNRSVKDNVLTALGEKAFQTVIRSNVAIAEAPTAGQSIFDYAPRSNGATDYKKLVNEIIANYG